MASAVGDIAGRAGHGIVAKAVEGEFERGFETWTRKNRRYRWGEEGSLADICSIADEFGDDVRQSELVVPA